MVNPPPPNNLRLLEQINDSFLLSKAIFGVIYLNDNCQSRGPKVNEPLNSGCGLPQKLCSLEVGHLIPARVAHIRRSLQSLPFKQKFLESWLA